MQIYIVLTWGTSAPLCNKEIGVLGKANSSHFLSGVRLFFNCSTESTVYLRFATGPEVSITSVLPLPFGSISEVMSLVLKRKGQLMVSH